MAFSDNLRRLRLDKQYTQEQTAEALGVSPQSVSRWECGNTYPDVMLLPRIARLYGVTVDDLYREDAKGYTSYAQRLLAVYEVSGRSEDLLAAEREFARMGVDITADDLRSWGVLYHYMMKRCAVLAQEKLEAAIAASGPDDWVCCSAAQQKLLLMCDLGRGADVVKQYDRELQEDLGDVWRWLMCTAAHYFAGDFERALEVACQGTERFPDNAALHIYAGDACWELEQHEKALDHWQKVQELDSTCLDAMFSMGFCYEKLGRYRDAYGIWTKLAGELKGRGLTVGAEVPARQAKLCKEKMGDR